MVYGPGVGRIVLRPGFQFERNPLKSPHQNLSLRKGHHKFFNRQSPQIANSNPKRPSRLPVGNNIQEYPYPLGFMDCLGYNKNLAAFRYGASRTIPVTRYYSR